MTTPLERLPVALEKCVEAAAKNAFLYSFPGRVWEATSQNVRNWWVNDIRSNSLYLLNAALSSGVAREGEMLMDDFGDAVKWPCIIIRTDTRDIEKRLEGEKP